MQDSHKSWYMFKGQVRIVIVFVKTDMSQTIVRAKETIENHISNSAKQIKELAESHIVSKNIRKEDKNKTVEIHYLFYNFPPK